VTLPWGADTGADLDADGGGAVDCARELMSLDISVWGTQMSAACSCCCSCATGAALELSRCREQLLVGGAVVDGGGVGEGPLKDAGWVGMTGVHEATSEGPERTEESDVLGVVVSEQGCLAAAATTLVSWVL
jgi:hypothetical protein